MAALAAPTQRGQVTSSLVSTYKEIFDTKQGFMQTYNVEREEQIELLGLSLAAGLDPLFLGDPGVGKTWMIELLLMVIDGAKSSDFFNTMVFKETPADDLLGMRSLPAMKLGKIERLMDGYLPTAIVGYLDEIFKASPTLVNSLLDIMANRKLKVGSTVHDVSQLLCIFASSNELPDREDLSAFRDRFGLTNFVPPVKTPDGRKRVMTIMDEFQAGARSIDLTDAPRLSIQEIQEIRAEVRGIIVPDTVKEALSSAQEQWEGKGFAPSQRRIGQMLMGLKARAWSRGEGHVSTDDLIVCAHMAWNHPDHAKDAREVVLKFANAFARKASQMRTGLEPVLGGVSDLQKRLNEGGRLEDKWGGSDPETQDDTLDNVGFKLMRNLRTMVREAKTQIEQGEAQGHDVTDLERVREEVERAHTWLKKTLAGDDE